MGNGVRLEDEELGGRVVAGVDTHADTHWLCVLDGNGRVALSEEFPATAEGYAALADAMGTDKKLSGGTMHLVVPREIGRCEIVAVPRGEVSDWLRAGGVR